MIRVIQNSQNDIPFVLVDAVGDEVTGLAGAFTVNIRKAGGAFAASAGTKSELGNGWYNYRATATECNTEGALALRITGAGVQQQNVVVTVVEALDVSEIEIIGPVMTGGDVVTYQGDTYLDEDDRSLEWESDDWPDLTGGTVTVIIDRVAQFTGEVVTPTAPALVRLELTAAQSRTITAGRHNFQVVGTQADGDVATLVAAAWVSRSRAEV